MLSEFHIKWHWRPGKENVVADALSRKQEDLTTAREKILASREGRKINPAAIIKALLDPPATYPAETAVTYPDQPPHLLELENPRKVQLSRPKTTKQLGGTRREAASQKSRPKINDESRAEPQRAQHTGGPP